MENVLLNAALGYAERGWAVLPLVPKGKRPLIDGGFYGASKNPETIRTWWTRWPNANIGLATGVVSGLMVVDCDVKHGPDGIAIYKEWLAASLIPGEAGIETWTVNTPSGGKHYYYRCASERIGSPPNFINSVDARANGALVLLPPSIYPNGKTYTWEEGHSPDDMLDGPAQPPFAVIVEILAHKHTGRVEVPQEIPEGQRNGTLFKLGCSMRSQGFDADAIHAALQATNNNRCVPPLDDSEVETISSQAAKYEPGNLHNSGEATDTVTAAELMGKEFRSLVQPVRNLICEGLTLVVAASKIGKSWMVLLMGVCIAQGAPFWGRPTTKCRVLYLALEDSQRRLQYRLQTLQLDNVPDNLYLRTNVPQIGKGFEEELESWLSMDNAPAVVIVDTLQKIRGIDGAGKNAYQQDYEIMSRLKAIADRHRAAIICTHHNNKMRNVTDPFDKISGSNGIMGAADSILLINRERGQDTAKVMFTGRDIWGSDFIIRFENGRWEQVSENAEEYAARLRYENDPLVQTIRLLLKENPTGGRWSYEEIRDFGRDKLSFPPFDSGKECVKKLKDGVADDLYFRDGISVESSIRVDHKRGLEIRPRAESV